jgi:hypothetical protein
VNEPVDQIRIGQEGNTERHQIGFAGANGRHRLCRVIAAVGDIRTAETALQFKEVERTFTHLYDMQKASPYWPSISAACPKIACGLLSLMEKPERGDKRTPTRSAPKTGMTASTTSFRKRARFSNEMG